jgi:LPS-assembly lipoprotein
MRKAILIIFVSLFLSSCGFHLRGIVELPKWLENVYIADKVNDRDLITKLKVMLKSYKIRVNPDPSTASYWLIISKSTSHQQIISVGASTNPRQYQLILEVEYSLMLPKGVTLAENKVITVTRQLTINNNRILGSNEEEAILLEEMRQEAIAQLFNQLSKSRLNHAN